MWTFEDEDVLIINEDNKQGCGTNPGGCGS
jgi:hypothetical protein